MCRFAVYLGPELSVGALVTEPEHSLVRQSYQAQLREAPLNGDGFGIAWYVPHSPEPAVFRDITPAWSNLNLLHLARVTRSDCLMAHVRAATQGLPVQQFNCHPFSAGPFAFMHNGYLADFQRVRRRLIEQLSDAAFARIVGTTDSEHLFALFLDEARGLVDDYTVEDLAAALLRTLAAAERLRQAAGIDAPSLLNLAVTDGRRAVVSRYASDERESANTLFVSAGGRYACREGRVEMVPAGPEAASVVIASEPLSAGAGWEPVPTGHLILVDRDRSVRLMPIELPA